MEHQFLLSNNLTTGANASISTTNSESNKPHNFSHSRNVSLDSSLSRIKGLNINAVPLNNENNLNVSSLSPGAHSITGATEEAVNIAAALFSVNSSKGGSGSRGSSPASKKRLTTESSLGTENSGSGRRRSPLVSRKAPPGCDNSFTTPPSSRTRFSSNHEEDQQSMDERDLESRTSSNMFNESGDTSGLECSLTPHRVGIDNDDIDGSSPIYTGFNQHQKTKEALDQLQSKIQKTAELIKDEQRVRDENVNEYLKLSTNADRQQLARIKTVFEKKNQKSASNIQHLQKKLDNYRRRKKEIEHHGVPYSHRQPKEVLRDVGYGLKSVSDNIRDGFSGFSGKKGFIGKPKEIAHLIKNKFGSADNIKELGEEEKDEERNHHGSATLPPNSGLHPTTSSIALASKTQASGSGGGGSAGGGGGGSSGGGKLGSEEGSECNSSITSESISGGGVNMAIASCTSPPDHHGMSSFEVPIGTPFIESIMQELNDLKDENKKLRSEMGEINQLREVMNTLNLSVMEDKIRYERLEEQVNDLTELHQNEMENLKTAVKDLENMEEKVQYKNEESIRDLNEMVESCQAKIFRMEHQQAQQQQQFLTLEGLENTNARMLFVKLINILLTVLQVLLLVVATIAGILTPLLQTKTRLITTVTLCFFILFLYLQLSEIRDTWQVFLSRITEFLS